MNCRNCGARVEPNELVCGNCGTVVDVSPRIAPIAYNTQPHPAAIKLRRRLSSTAILILLFACGMITLIAASIVGGITTGLQDREIDRQVETDKYYHEGLTNFASGQLELAEADFQYVLKLNPNYPGASEQLLQVRTRLTVQPTPTVAVSSTKVIDQLFQTGQSSYQAKDWAKAIEVLTRAGWSPRLNGNRHLHIPIKRRDEPARLNALLVGQGFEVDHVSVDQPSLEDIFLELTQTTPLN